MNKIMEILDSMEVRVEVSESSFSDEVKVLQKRETSLQKSIKEFLGVSARVRLVEPRSIERSEGKAVRIIDLRGQSQ